MFHWPLQAHRGYPRYSTRIYEGLIGGVEEADREWGYDEALLLPPGEGWDEGIKMAEFLFCFALTQSSPAGEALNQAIKAVPAGCGSTSLATYAERTAAKTVLYGTDCREIGKKLPKEPVLAFIPRG